MVQINIIENKEKTARHLPNGIVFAFASDVISGDKYHLYMKVVNTNSSKEFENEYFVNLITNCILTFDEFLDRPIVTFEAELSLKKQ